MQRFYSILDAVREFWLTCIGSPLSRARQLAALRKLDAHLLKDIGLSPEEVRRGDPFGAKPVKQAPRPEVGVGIRGAYPNR